MHVILILVCSIAILIVGPTTTTSSKMLRTMATALASVAICLISLKMGFVVIAVLSMVLLRCASLISIILKLTLTILRSLASISLCETSKLSVTTLTSKRSASTQQNNLHSIEENASSFTDDTATLCDFTIVDHHSDTENTKDTHTHFVPKHPSIHSQRKHFIQKYFW